MEYLNALNLFQKRFKTFENETLSQFISLIFEQWSQSLAGGHLRRKDSNVHGLSFVAYEILSSSNDEIEDIKN